jgi:NifU-like protein
MSEKLPDTVVKASQRDGNMPACCNPTDVQSCPGRIVCRCLQITEKFVVEAVHMLELQTVKDIQQFTSAGGGCTACHCELKKILEEHPYSVPICSVK